MRFKKTKILYLFFLIIFGLFVLTANVYGKNHITVSNVSKEFICNCGCKKMLWDCASNMPECSIGQNMTKLIDGKINDGWSKKQIMAYMVKNYEEQILAAPTKKGFNLVAWVTPFLLVLFGGIGLYFIITRWVRQQRGLRLAGAEKFVGETSKKKSPYKKRLKEELDKFEF